MLELSIQIKIECIGFLIFLTLLVAASNATDIGCKDGWSQQNNYCYLLHSMGYVEGPTWLKATEFCFSQDNRSVPLVENDQSVLKNILSNNSINPWAANEVFIGQTEFGGTKKWIDGSTKGIWSPCVNQRETGSCGVLVADLDHYTGFCIQYSNCHKTHLGNIRRWYSCQYKPAKIKCEDGYVLDANGDDCYKFIPSIRESWNKTFCNSLMEGATLAYLDMDDHVDDMIWMMREAQQYSNPNCDPTNGESIRLGIYTDSGVAQWLYGEQLPLAITEAMPINPSATANPSKNQVCGALLVNTCSQDRQINFPLKGAIDFVDCDNQAVQPAIYLKTPGKLPRVKRSIAENIARTTKTVACARLLDCLAQHPNVDPVPIDPKKCPEKTTAASTSMSTRFSSPLISSSSSASLSTRSSKTSGSASPTRNSSPISSSARASTSSSPTSSSASASTSSSPTSSSDSASTSSSPTSNSASASTTSSPTSSSDSASTSSSPTSSSASASTSSSPTSSSDSALTSSSPSSSSASASTSSSPSSISPSPSTRPSPTSGSANPSTSLSSCVLVVSLISLLCSLVTAIPAICLQATMLY